MSTTFDIVFGTTTGGGPAQSTQVFHVSIFKVFGQGLFARTSAISMVLFMVIVLLAVPLILFLRKREDLL